jgi:hypothetical protein
MVEVTGLKSMTLRPVSIACPPYFVKEILVGSKVISGRHTDGQTHRMAIS